MKPRTLGELREIGWKSRSVRDELRENLVASLRAGKSASDRWPGILGFEKTVIPQVENAILSRHDFILLGLRGQAKTRILRLLVHFLDEEMPALEGCDLNDDPLHVLSLTTTTTSNHGNTHRITGLPGQCQVEALSHTFAINRCDHDFTST